MVGKKQHLCLNLPQDWAVRTGRVQSRRGHGFGRLPGGNFYRFSAKMDVDLSSFFDNFTPLLIRILR